MRTALKWSLAPNRWLAARNAGKTNSRRQQLARAVASSKQKRRLEADRRQRTERQAPL
jgi:hypothetical protein